MAAFALSIERDTPDSSAGETRKSGPTCPRHRYGAFFFTDARVPASNLLGSEREWDSDWSRTFPKNGSRSPWVQLLQRAKHRGAGHLRIPMNEPYLPTIAAFQNSRFVLAECAIEIEIAEVFLDRCIEALNAEELTAEEAAMAKWWTTELQSVPDFCVQLHGGYGYMLEYPIARAYLDTRIQRFTAGPPRS